MVALVSIDDFNPSCADALVRMWRASFELGVGVVDPHPIEEHVDFLLAKVVPANRVRVVRQDSKLVGFMANTPDSISQLYVHVDHVAQGIGSKLIGLAQAESPGSLWLFTFAKNLRACSFYERHGFKVAARGFEPFWKLEDVKYIWHRQQCGLSQETPLK